MANKVKRSSPLTWLVDSLEPSRDQAEGAYHFGGGSRAWLLLVGVGAALLVLSIVGWVVSPREFYYSYLTGWTFCLSLSTGALYFLFFHHLSGATWHIVVRRFAEALAGSFPLLLVLGIPLLFGMHELYPWTHAEAYAEGTSTYDVVLAGKRSYLNEPFFFLRMILYFAVWIVVSHKLYTLSVRHDTREDYETPAKLRKVSAWGLFIMALTTLFASIDLLKSLDPQWFSTMFGVYFFAGSMFVIFPVLTLTAVLFQRFGGKLRGAITIEHYHDMGKWMFGFTIFWAYIAFSQYMLYWYGGIPEETLWFRHRLEHGWEWHSAMLLAFHFVVPFLVLLPRFTKRLVPVLSFMAVWFIVMQWFDLHWVVMPALGVGAEAGPPGFHWLNLTTWLGLAGVFAGFFLFRLGRHPLVPQHDPRLPESLVFENV